MMPLVSTGSLCCPLTVVRLPFPTRPGLFAKNAIPLKARAVVYAYCHVRLLVRRLKSARRSE
jgi:hypothetical protein